jgi:hypothetical protein
LELIFSKKGQSAISQEGNYFWIAKDPAQAGANQK